MSELSKDSDWLVQYDDICEICGGTLIYEYSLNKKFCDTCDYEETEVM